MQVRRAPVDALRELATASCVSAVQSSRKHRVVVVGRRAVEAQPHGHGEVEKEHLGRQARRCAADVAARLDALAELERAVAREGVIHPSAVCVAVRVAWRVRR